MMERPMTTRGRSAFTLIEVLMAFGAGSILLAVIYFFHFGLVKTWSKTTDKLDLNTRAEVALETITRDLRMAHHITELKSDQLIMQKLPSEAVQSWEGFSRDNLRLVSIEYLLKKDGNHTCLIRRLGLGDAGLKLFDVPEASKEIFTGYVLDLPKEKGDPFPRFHLFDMLAQPSGELPKVTLVSVRLALKTPAESIELISKVHLPVAHANVLQADWNVE